jgi:hypothetical protein
VSGLTTGPDAVGPAGGEGPGAPLRVAHVLDSFTAGGAQAVAVQLSAWLAARGAEAHLLGVDGPLAADARRAHGPARVHVRPGTVAVGGSVGRFVAGLRALDRACREVRPHVLHAHQRREALQCLLVGARHGVPVVEHAHTYLPRAGLRALSFRSAAVFAVSDHVGAMIADRFGRHDGVLVVGNAPARTTARCGSSAWAGSSSRRTRSASSAWWRRRPGSSTSRRCGTATVPCSARPGRSPPVSGRPSSSRATPTTCRRGSTRPTPCS